MYRMRDRSQNSPRGQKRTERDRICEEVTKRPPEPHQAIPTGPEQGWRVHTDDRQTLRFHIDTANIEIHTDREKSQLVHELKEKWGVPFSIMRFDRENHQLARICRQVTKHTECRVTKGNVTGREIPNYSGFVDHSLFLLDYFVRDKGSRVLDNLWVRGQISLLDYGWEWKCMVLT